MSFLLDKLARGDMFMTEMRHVGAIRYTRTGQRNASLKLSEDHSLVSDAPRGCENVYLTARYLSKVLIEKPRVNGIAGAPKKLFPFCARETLSPELSIILPLRV